jgi:outer membrane protein assembly factor BamB
MRALRAIREPRRLTLSAIALGALSIACTASAQQLQIFIGAAGPTPFELTAPHMETVSGATAARLEQARSLASGRHWDEAIDILGEIAADRSGRVVSIDNTRFVSLRTYCQFQLAGWPAEGLAAYRRRVDPQAEQSYRTGLGNRDEQLLRRVVDEWFCSSWGDDALLSLGEVALERGDYSTARRYWEQISPLLRSPNGMPMSFALRKIDFNQKWSEVERRWQSRQKPADWLVYPDTQLDLAQVSARLALVSIRAGELDRAKLELEVFRRLHPKAVGTLGGQKELLATALERLVSSAKSWPADVPATDWPTFGGSLSRSAIAAPVGEMLLPAWKQPVSLSPPQFARSSRLAFGDVIVRDAADDQPGPNVRESQRPLSCFPIIIDRTILFADGSGVRAVDLATGKPAVASQGMLYRNESPDENPVRAQFGAETGVAHGVPRLTLNFADGILFDRVGPFATSRGQNETSAKRNQIIGLDLRREALLTFRCTPEDESWSFDGVPVSDGQSVFVAMRKTDVSPHAYVACFDAASGAPKWRRSVGAADTPAGGGDEITHNLLTLVENRIYFNTNLGLITALDSETGEICWLSRYDRRAGKAFSSGPSAPAHFDRVPSPCVYDDGILFVAPSDTPSILALDAETGKTIWQSNQLPDAMHVLGVAAGHLFVNGDRLAALGIATGNVDWMWPESDRAGIRGMGRGVVAGNEIFWPTRDRIYVLDVRNGSQTRSPISLAPLTGGANLVAASGRLIVAGYDNLLVLAPSDVTAVQPAKIKPSPSPVRTGQIRNPFDENASVTTQ